MTIESSEALAVRVVVFDLDGTLIDSNAIKRTGFEEVAGTVPGGAEIIENILADHSEGTRHQIFSALACRLHPAEPSAAERLAEALVARYTWLTNTRVATCREIPGATATLDALAREGFQLALNSATPTTALAEILTNRGWRLRFASVRGVPPGKAENLLAIAAELGIAQTEMVMVGDREGDRRAAERAGCSFVALLRADSDFTVPLPRRIRELNELPRLLTLLTGHGTQA